MSVDSGMVGLKMPLDWRRDPACAPLHVSYEDPLSFLAEMGLGFVEYGLGNCCSQEESELLEREAEQCAHGGLGVSLHPYLTDDNPGTFGERAECRETLEAILAAASETCEVTGRRVVAVFHPAHAFYQPGHTDLGDLRARLTEASVRYFRAALRLAQETGGKVTVVAEYQVPPGTDEALVRTGDNVRELLAISEGSGVELCLDTGHYLLSTLRRGQPGQPPPQLLSRVGYIHLHDVVDGCDHRPISHATGRPLHYVRLLEKCGYSGRITLEYDAQAVGKSGGIEKALDEGLAALRGRRAGC